MFRRFINVGGYRPGLSITVAQRVLRRQSGEIFFFARNTRTAVSFVF